jgi:hypothetical protein
MFMRILGLVLGVWLWVGCYSFTQSTLPAHLRTLTILPVQNRTAQSLLGDQMTRAIQESMRRNAPQLRQVSQGGQAEFAMSLVDYRNAPASFTTGGTVQNYQVSLTVDVKFYDGVKKRILYEQKSVTVRGQYDLTRGETEIQGQTRALKELDEVVVANALSDW